MHDMTASHVIQVHYQSPDASHATCTNVLYLDSAALCMVFSVTRSDMHTLPLSHRLL